MLEALFGNSNVEKVLFYLLRYGQGYARGMASTFSAPLTPLQMQLARLERGGVIVSRMAGRTRLYEMNPRYPFRRELVAFLNQAFKALPDNQVKRYYSNRSRPRRQGKDGKRKKESVLDFFRRSPLRGSNLRIERDKSPMRKVDL